VFPSSELIRSWVNVDEAVNYGLELEARAPLAAVASALESFALNANLTLVASEVTTGGTAAIYLPGTGATDIEIADKTRALQGQSPYVANLGLTYANEDRGLTAASTRSARKRSTKSTKRRAASST
jgi:outer membrane receptor protein involved in Fe transport